MNEQGEILLQKRASTKRQEPNKWAICAGHIDAGETVENAILREMEEELSEIKYIPFAEFEDIVKNKDENVTFTKQEYMPEMIEILRKKI